MGPHRCIRELEKVQRKAIRFVKNCYDKSVSVTAMLRAAGWESLADRRLNHRINLLDKFRGSTFSDDVADIMRPPCYIGRCDNARKIREIDARTNRFKNSFFPRKIRESFSEIEPRCLHPCHVPKGGLQGIFVDVDVIRLLLVSFH